MFELLGYSAGYANLAAASDLNNSNTTPSDKRRRQMLEG
jgi:hypothetical protein